MTDLKERILVHGPCLQDLTDLLYFDKIVYPMTKAMIRPDNLAPGYVGYSAQEPIPEDVRNRLTEADLIIAPGTLLFASQGDERVSKMLGGSDSAQQWMPEHVAESSKILGEIFIGSLELPASNTDVATWLQDLDAKAKMFTDHAVKLGKRAVAKFYAEDVDKTLQPGWDAVLSITFPKMPCVVPGRPEIDDLVRFLNDEETKRKRAALFNWHCGIDTAVQQGRISMEEVPDRIDALLEDYTGWLRQSGLFAGARPCEFLMTFDNSFIEGLVSAVQLRGNRSAFAVGRRGLKLIEESPREMGREIAYIAHTGRNWREWFPMVS